MRRLEPDQTRIAAQAEIRAKFGEAKIQEFRVQYCTVCSGAIWSGGPCNLLPITSEGKVCPYFDPSAMTKPGGDHNG